MIIEQQDFLQEYLKNKPEFTYKEINNILEATSTYIFIKVDLPFLFIRPQVVPLNNDVASFPPRTFEMPETYKEFKTIMDIFLGVENGKQE